MAQEDAEKARRGGVQSVEVGGRLLEALIEMGAPAPLKTLADAAGMPAAKAHRYLASLSEIGLVAQRQDTAKYGLGPMALRLGLAAMSQNDVLEHSSALLGRLCDALVVSGHISIWSERGPVVVRTAHGGPPVISPIGVGSILPLFASATGQVFLAHMPPAATEPVAGTQRAGRGAPPNCDPARDGFALAAGDYLPGLNAVAFPAFGYDGVLVCSLTFIHTDDAMFTRGGPAMRRLRTEIEVEQRRWRLAERPERSGAPSYGPQR